ncbi:MAG: D-alanyl-D-alanine carboxypeptidase family protein [Pseudomonadota bacterium]
MLFKGTRRATVLVVLALFSLAGHAAGVIVPAPPQLSATGYLLMDAATGKVLVDFNSEQRLPPASLTKIMTSYVVEHELDRGSITMNDMVDISVKAWRMEGSRMFVREGTKVRLEDLLRGVIIQSGNDASVALAEHIAGSEDVFADMMNQHAARLGMTNTNYVNSTGLPDENHYTTARDLALLSVALIEDFPQHYAMYSEKYFTYNDIRQPNRNSLLWRDPSVDGVKTGHTEAAGFCLVASAERNGMRLVSVVMGTSSEEARAVESQKLLTYGFRYFETVPLYKAAEALRNVRVWRGDRDSVGLGLVADAVLTIPRGGRESLEAKMDINAIVEAPFDQGDKLGRLTVSMGDEVVFESDLVALAPVAEAGFFSRVWDALALFFMKIFGGDPLAI